MSDEPTSDELLDAPTLARGLRIGRPHVGERVFARDRAGGHAVLATIRPSGRGGGKWYWSFELYERVAGRWTETGDGNGDRWPDDPDAPRPATAGFETATGTSGFGGIVVVGGVVGRPVATLEMATARDRHLVEIDPQTGAYTAIGLGAGDDCHHVLTARAADGTVIDEIRHEPPPRFAQLYHLSPVENRASILAHGLDARRMDAAPGLAGSERYEREGVYVFTAPDKAKWWAKLTAERHVGGLDLWEIAALEARLETDPQGFDYIAGVVPPERIRLRTTFSAEQLVEMAAGGPGPDVFDAVDGVNGAVIVRVDPSSGRPDR